METSTIKNQMEKTIEHLEKEFSQLQIGRASTSLVDNIDVFIPSWDMKQKINQLGNVSIMDSQTLKIECWEKSNISLIEKAIYESGIGLTPQNMGEYLIIKIPPLTKERRIELTKFVSKIGEEAKVRIRNSRHDGLKILKKEVDEKLISEDEKKGKEKTLDEFAKDYNGKIEKLIKLKSEEIMKV